VATSDNLLYSSVFSVPPSKEPEPPRLIVPTWSVQVNENGEIEDSVNRRVGSCLLCTQIIKLYRLRNVCIVFKPQEVFK